MKTKLFMPKLNGLFSFHIKNLKEKETILVKTHKSPAYNTGFTSGGLTCKLEALCFYASVVQVDSFVHRNPPERKAAKRYSQWYDDRTANKNYKYGTSI